MSVVNKAFGLKLAAHDPNGQPGLFSGVAVVYNEKDAHGDTIRMGAFAKSIAEAGGKLPLLWVHDMREVLGTLRVEQDNRSLNISGSLLVDDIPRAKEVHSLLRAGAVKGLSVGFLPLRTQPLGGGAVEFLEGRLLEVSLCPAAAFPSAQVTSVHAITDLAEALDPMRDREALLALRNSIDAMLHTGPPALSPELVQAFSVFNPKKWRER